jgi:hypothetical protein
MTAIRTISLIAIYIAIISIALYINGAFGSDNNTVEIDVELPDVTEIQEVKVAEGVDKKTDISHAKLIILNKDYIKPVVLDKININQL